MTEALFVVGGLFLLVYAPLAVLAWRRPLLARFAWREGTRRRGQFALLVVGLLAGSASITASLVAGDSATHSLAYITNQRLGAVDLTVTGDGNRSFPVDIATQLASNQALTPYVDGVQAGFETPVSVADVDQRLGKPNVLLVGFDPGSQQRFGAYVLSGGRRIYGGELGAGDVVLSHDLATDLDAKVGDHLRIATGAGSGSADLRVYAISAAYGPGAYGSPFAAFMTLATARSVTGDPGLNLVRVAARGGTSSDTGAARRAAAPLRHALAQIQSPTPLTVNEKRLELARQLVGQTAWILGINLGFSGLTVLAAIALIVNLVLALADERRSRLAVLRALGLTRAGLVTLSVLEGAIYSLGAALAGVAVGVLAGLFLAGQVWNALIIDPTDQAYTGFPMTVTVSPGTLALAFAAGALITLATVAGAAYRTSRIAIAAAIRDLPDPATAARRRWPRTGLLVVVAALGAALLVPADPRTRLIGGVALIATVAALARGRISDRTRATLAGLLTSAWAVVTVAETNHLTSDLGVLLTMIILGVSVPAVGLSIAAAANLKLIDDCLGLAGNRLGHFQATLRPPLAYLSRRPVRTGLATSAFALVLVMVSVIAVAVASTNRDYARDSAGYDIQVVTSSSDPIQLPPDVAQQVTAQIAIPMRLYQGPFQAPAFGGEGSSVPTMFYELPDQLQDGPVYLNVRDKHFTKNAEVWRALRADPGRVVFVGTGGAAPGDALILRGPDGPIQMRVAADEASTILNGVIASPATVAEVATTPAGSTVLLSTRQGSNPQALAREIERSLFAQGVQATSIREILDQDYASNLAYTTEYDVLLHMGLLVGVLALAMIGIRAAIERRRVIGILRALGYQPTRLLAGLIAEASLTATIGVITGIGAGLIIGYYLIGASEPGSTFGVDFGRLLFAVAIVYATVLVVTGPLASRAARMAPTEAIRLTG
jgi:ABC-type antimicrobial peptide transport system permease subunit